MELEQTHEESGAMMNEKKKVCSQAGESISETLISLLVAALALVMLAGAIASSSNVITKSKDKMNSYYSANEASDGVVKMTGGTSTGGINISDTTSAISTQSYNVYYYKNDTFSNNPVVAYSYSAG